MSLYRKPDWNHWRSISVASLAECVCLTCAIDLHGWVEGLHKKIYEYGMRNSNTPESAWPERKRADLIAEREFAKRWPIACGAVSAKGPLRPDSTVTYDDVGKVRIQVAEFVDWAITQGWTMPDELKTIALRRRTAASSSADTSLWKVRACELATTYYKRDRARKLTPSKYHLAVEIAKTLEREGLKGPRGVVSPPTIVRHALKEWRKP